MRILRFLRNQLRGVEGIIHLVWIYLAVGGRFLDWRLRLWLRQKYMIGNTRDSMKQTLLFVRHGQTTWNVENRLPGQIAGVALTETGKEQAARLGEALSSLPISAIISSPLERARDTAAYIAKGRNIEMQFEPDLMDTDIGHWAGKVIKELAQNDPGWKAYVKDPTVAPEGVETFPQVQSRVVAAVKRWLAKDIGAYPVFVAHADVIKLLVAYYTGLEAGRASSLMIENASVSLVEIEEGQRTRVLSIGWSPRPGWLTPPIEVAKKEVPEQEEAGEQRT